MPIFRETVACTPAAGSAGSATVSATSSKVVEGVVVAVYLEYLDSPPATTDVTITEANRSPALPVLSVANAAASGWFHPMWQADNEAGAAITNQGTPVRVADYLTVTIAEANAGDGVNATIVWDDMR